MEHHHLREALNNGNPYIVGIIVGIIILLVIIFIVYNHSKKSEPEQPEQKFTESQNEKLENFTGLVCSMLTQKGGGIKQNEIRENLGLPVDIVAEKLLQMEKEGLIKRIWENDDFTYTIFKSEK